MHQSVHHGKWKKNQPNVNCATTHLQQINLCNKYLKNVWVFHAHKYSSWRVENKPFKCHLCNKTFTANQHLQQVLEKYLGFSCTHKCSSWRVEDKSFQCHLCHNTFTASQHNKYLKNIWVFSCTQVIIMESGRQVIPMSLVPQHIYCKSTQQVLEKYLGFFLHTSDHHGEWKTSHSNVTCALHNACPGAGQPLQR